MPKKHITIPVFIPHYGCPHHCVFCNQWRVTGIKAEVKPESVHEIINKYLSSVPESVEKVELAFFGGSFTAIPAGEQERFLSAVKPYVDRGIIDSIRLSTRPDYIDQARLEFLKDYGVKTVELGVQSFSDEILKASGRGHDSSHTTAALSMLRYNGFRTGVQLMPGLPGDTFATSVMSASRAIELMPDDVRIYPAVVLKDTMLEKMYYEKRFIPLTVEEAVELCAVMYGMFNEKGINVIRMGLHPMEPGGGHVIAGPYHEALGFMVKSRYRRGILESVIRAEAENAGRVKKIYLIIPENLKEEFIGMKKENILYLKKKFNLHDIKYRFDDVNSPLISV